MRTRLRLPIHRSVWLTLLATVTLFLSIFLNGLTTAPAFEHLMDFGSFIAASRENAQGNDPYTTRSPLVFQIHSQRTGQVLLSPNLNPPLSLFLFSPLASLNPLRAANGWRMTSAALYAACILLLALAYPRAASIPRLIWAVSLAGFWHTLAVGQIYILLLLPILAVWILTERGYLVLAGIALGGIIALRPNFLFWLALLAVSGDRVVVRSALISGLALSILPIAMYGPSVYAQWLSALTAYPGAGLLIAGNSSLASLMARAGSPLPDLLLAVPFAIIMLFILNRTRKNKPLEHIHMLGLVGSLLISPFSWVGYTILTLPIFLTREHWSWQLVLAAALLAFPYLLVLMFFQVSMLSSIVFGWVYGWGLLLILLEPSAPVQGSMPTA